MTLFWEPSVSNEGKLFGIIPVYAVVIDIISNEEHPDYNASGFNVGSIRFKYLDYGGHRDTPVNAYYAQPVDITLQEYPLIGEIVLVQKVQGIHYYSRRINVNKTLQLNTLPNIIDRLKPSHSSIDRSNNTQQAREGILNQTNDDPEENLVNLNYKPNTSIHSLKSFDGDVIIQNRYGASIRFGSSQSEDALNQKTVINNNKTILGPTKSKSNDPIIILRIGENSINKTVNSSYALVMEDINLDSSCFVLSQNQQIDFKFSSLFDTLTQLKTNIYFPSSGNKSVLLGNQIILNSGRLVLNSKENDIIFSSNRDFISISNRDIILDTERNLYLNPSNGFIFLGTDVDDKTIDNYVVKFNELEEILELILNLISTLANQTQYQFPNPSVVSQSHNALTKLDNIRSRLVKIKS